MRTSKEISKDMTYLNSSLVMGALTITLLLVVNYISDMSRISDALVVLSGMTAMGSFSSLQRYLENRGTVRSLPISFNEEFLSTSVSEAFHKIVEESSLRGKMPYNDRSLPPWVLTGDQLVGKDNALALAKLRIDLESELRHIAYNNEIVDISDRSGGAIEIARKLISKNILPAEVLEPLRHVIDVCNRGIHGEEITTNVASSVINIGSQILERLQHVQYGHR